MQPKVHAHNYTNNISCKDDTNHVKDIKNLSGQISRIVFASCLQQDKVSGPHKSVYVSKARILVCSSLNSHVRHSAHEEWEKLHLELSFMVY